MEDEHSQMSDEQLLAEYDKLLADVENGLVEASPAQVVELREKREAYVKSIDDEKTAIRNKALADARVEAAADRVLRAFDDQERFSRRPNKGH